MASPHYTPSGKPVQGSHGTSKDMRDEFELVETGIENINEWILTITYEDINFTISEFVTVPWACKIKQIWGVNSAANSVAETIITIELGGVPVTMPVFKWAATAPVETVITSIPTTGNVLSAGAAIQMVSDRGGSAVVPAVFTLLLQRT